MPVNVRILVYGLNFAPELTGIGKFTGDMVKWLSDHGHQVCVVTAPPYYPEWRVHSGYSAFGIRHERLHGASIWRAPIWVPERPGALKRLLHLGTFALSSAPIVFAHLLWRPQVVWTVAPSFMGAPLAWTVARLCGARCWLHVQDFEVEAAFNLGLMRSTLLRSAALAIERWWLCRFDRVSTISRRMMEGLQQKGVRPSRIAYFPNWVDVRVIDSFGISSGFRMELGISKDAVVALYSGNMGEKQGVEVLAEVARLVPDVEFVFCGEGVGKQLLLDRCGHLRNVRILGLQSVDRLPELLRMADVHLLPQRADVADLVMPSKLTGMLASGRPIVATAKEGTELASVVCGVGLVVPPGDAGKMAEAIRKLAGDVGLRTQLGAAGRQYAEQFLAKDVVLERFAKELVLLAEDGDEGQQ